jgi:hypothetical protein
MVMDFPFNNNSKILTFENVILSNVDTLNVIFVDIIVVIIYIYHHHADFKICEDMEKLGREMAVRVLVYHWLSLCLEDFWQQKKHWMSGILCIEI